MEATNPRLNKVPMIVIASLVFTIGVVCLAIGFPEADRWQSALVTLAVILWALAIGVVVHHFYKARYLDRDESLKWRILRKVVPALAGLGIVFALVFVVIGAVKFVNIGVLLVWLGVLTFAVGVMGTRGPHQEKTTYGPAPRREGEDLDFELGNSLIFGLVKPGEDTGAQQAIRDDVPPPAPARQPMQRFEEDPRNWTDGRPPESMRDLYRPAGNEPPRVRREDPDHLDSTQFSAPPTRMSPPPTRQTPPPAPSQRPQSQSSAPSRPMPAPRVGSVEPVQRPMSPHPGVRRSESASRPSGGEFKDPRWGEQAPPAENLDWLYAGESSTSSAPSRPDRAPANRPDDPRSNVEGRRRPPVNEDVDPYSRPSGTRTSAPQPRTSAPQPRTSAPQPRTSAPQPQSRPSAPQGRPAAQDRPVDAPGGFLPGPGSSRPSAPNRRPAFPGEDGAPQPGAGSGRDRVSEADFRPQERRRPPVQDTQRNYPEADAPSGPPSVRPYPGLGQTIPAPNEEERPLRVVSDEAPRSANTPPRTEPGKPRRAMPAD